MVREATTMQEEERMVMIGLKMCARVDGAGGSGSPACL